MGVSVSVSLSLVFGLFGLPPLAAPVQEEYDREDYESGSPHCQMVHANFYDVLVGLRFHHLRAFNRYAPDPITLNGLI